MMSQNILLLSWTHSQQAIRRSVTTKKKQQNRERERERGRFEHTGSRRSDSAEKGREFLVWWFGEICYPKKQPRKDSKEEGSLHDKQIVRLCFQCHNLKCPCVVSFQVFPGGRKHWSPLLREDMRYIKFISEGRVFSGGSQIRWELGRQQRLR